MANATLKRSGSAIQSKAPEPVIAAEIMYLPSTGESILLTKDDLEELDAYVEEMDTAITDFRAACDQANKISVIGLPEEQAIEEQKKKDAILGQANNKLNTVLIKVGENISEEEAKKKAESQYAALASGSGSSSKLTEGMAFGAQRSKMIPNHFIERIRSEEDIHSKKIIRIVSAPATDENKPVDSYSAFRNDDGELDKQKVSEAFKKVSAEAKASWNIYKNDGQISSKTAAKFVSPILAQFISDESYELCDSWIANFNKEHATAKGRNEKKKEKLLALLEQKDFEIDEAERAFVYIDDLWDDAESSDIKNGKTPKDVADSNRTKNALISKVKAATLPPVYWDCSSGAQLMRYAVKSDASFAVDLSKGVIKAGVTAEADYALAQGKANIDGYLPNDKGFEMAFNAIVRKQIFKPIDAQIGGEDLPCYFYFDNSLVTPYALASACQFLTDKSKVKIDSYIVQVVGHTDKPGTESYNLSLSDRRAKAMYAFLSNDMLALFDFVKDKTWGIEEKQYMLAAIYFLETSPKDFEACFIADTQYVKNAVPSHPIFKDIPPQKKQVVVKPIGYLKDFNAVITKHPLFDSLTDIKERKKILLDKYYSEPKPSKKSLLNIEYEAMMSVNRPGYVGIPELNFNTLKKQDIDNDVAIVLSYRNKLLNYLTQRYSGIDKIEYASFFTRPEELSNIDFSKTDGKGAVEPKIYTGDREYRNRRIGFKAYRIVEDKEADRKVETKINLGTMRLHVEGFMSAWAGVNVSVSVGVNIECPKGKMALTGLNQQGQEELARQNQNSKNGDADIGGQGEAIAGIKVEAGVKADLEWTKPGASLFNSLASVGYTATGIAGASIAGEFKIGFDPDSKRFVIKMKAQAAWGLGLGGSLSVTVSLNNLYDFTCLVYEQLMTQDFCFVDMFEGKGEESETDVFDIFNAMCTHLLLTGHPLVAGTAYLATRKTTLKAAAAFLDQHTERTIEYKRNSKKQENLEDLAASINGNDDFITRLTPETKGRILYLLCTTERSWYEKISFSGINEDFEDAALKLITKGIVSKRDWQETLEHMAQTNTTEAYVSSSDKKNRESLSEEEVKERANRALYNNNLLKNSLYANESKKWRTIQKHINNLQEAPLK
ncbi:OmpA family protein [Saccharicrinis aurantiacus]|uniref:OmpA family protein n=1 Tax=Saccharicrinis aurantiacus TaxID=1849719 RepID=UPI00094FE005|nr:OmpA family protein [Saccharicrinis aurantiacus]